MSEPQISPQPIFQMLDGFEVSAILRSAIELGIFDPMAEGASDAGSIAKRIKADARGTKILLDAMCAVGLAENQGDKYSNTPLSNTFLVRGKPTFVGGLAEVFAPAWTWQAFGRLTEAVRHGGTIMEQPAETAQHPWWGDFAANIGAFAGPASEAMAGTLAPWASKRKPLDILDVACGNGFYGLRIAQQQAHARLWELDWPHVIKQTRENAAQFGVSDRTSYIEGDIFATPLAGPYDLAILSQILHHFSEDKCVELLKRVAASLKPDGRIVIQEFVPVGSATENPMPRLFSVLMLVWTSKGEAHSLARLERMLGAAGFGAPTVHEIPHMPSRLLVADRAAR